MSVRRLAEEQPASFEFTPENRAWADKQIAKYPPGRQASAVIPLLWRAQKQSNYWLSKPAIETVAKTLDMPYIRVLEVATFYTMFNLAPVGRQYVQLCGTTPCVLRGAEDLKKVCERRIGPQGRLSADGALSWIEVECLGGCCNAPMAQINDDFYEDLTAENFAKLLDDLAAGRPVTKGSQIGRVSSEPIGGLTSLTDPSIYKGGSSGQMSAAPHDGEAAKPGAAANVEEAPAPKPPVKSSTKPRRK
jgi:NADH-quinone oxidoreductase subunit E